MSLEPEMRMRRPVGSGVIRPNRKQQFLRTLKKLDMHAKVESEVVTGYQVKKTKAGAALSTITLAIIAVLFLGELRNFARVHHREHLIVDPEMGGLLHIFLNVTFPAFPCQSVGLDVMDVTGHQQINVIRQMWKQRLNPDGSWIVADGNNPVAPSKASLSRLLRPDLDSHEGCIVAGDVEVHKVAGNFHIALGESHSIGSRHVHHFSASDVPRYNVSHTVNELRFGEYFPGQADPLRGTSKIFVTDAAAQADPNFDFGAGGGIYQYFLKVVPVKLKTGWTGRTTMSAQYQTTQHFRPIAKAHRFQRQVQLPGIFFVWDLSPFMVDLEEFRMPFSRFVTSSCAIVGGVYTIAGILDRLLFAAGNRLKKQG